MPESDFQTLREFYRLYPFDDLHRYHRPAALVGSSMGGSYQQKVDFLAPPPDPFGVPEGANFSEADLRTLRAFGVRNIGNAL